MSIIIKLKISKFLSNRDLVLFIVFLAVSVYFFVEPLLKAYGMYNTRFPLGWDSVLYARAQNDLLRHGPVGFISLNLYPHFYIFLLTGVGLLISDFYLSTIILPPIMSVVLSVLYYFITRELTQNKFIAGTVLVFSALSVGSIRMISDLHRQLLALIFIYTIFLLLRNGLYGRKKVCLFIAFNCLLAWTQIESYFIFLLSLAIYIIIQKDKRLFKYTLLSILILSLPLLSVAIPFYERSLKTMLETNHGLKTPITFAEFRLFSGASIFPLPLAGLLYVLVSGLYKRLKQFMILSIWSITILFLIFVTYALNIPLPQWRFLLLLPIPIFLTLILDFFLSYLKHKVSASERELEFRIYKISTHLRPSMLVKCLCVTFLTLIIVFPPYIDIQINSPNWYRTFIPSSAIDKLFYIKTSIAHANSPIFVFNKPFDNIEEARHNRLYISATVGEHLAYYGNARDLINLMSPEALYPENSLEYRIAKDFFSELTQKVNQTSMNDQFIIILSEFYQEKLESPFNRFEAEPGLWIFTLSKL